MRFCELSPRLGLYWCSCLWVILASICNPSPIFLKVAPTGHIGLWCFYFHLLSVSYVGQVDACSHSPYHRKSVTQQWISPLGLLQHTGIRLCLLCFLSHEWNLWSPERYYYYNLGWVCHPKAPWLLLGGNKTLKSWSTVRDLKSLRSIC